MKFHFLVLSVLIFNLNCNQSSDDDMTTEQIITLKFNAIPNSFYLKTRAWGVNHEQIWLTKNKPKGISDKETDYIFYCSEVFYKQTNDTIMIYAPQDLTLEPMEKFSEITVVIKGLANYDEIRDFDKNYGLNKVSTLDSHVT